MRLTQAECHIYNVSILWTGWLYKGLKVESIEPIVSKLYSVFSDKKFVNEALLSANKAFNMKMAKKSIEDALVELARGSSLQVAEITVKAVYRCPNPLTRLDYSVMHRNADMPSQNSDPEYLTASLAKGFNRKRLEGASMNDFEAFLLGSGISSTLVRTVNRATALIPRCGTANFPLSEFLQRSGEQALDLSVCKVVYGAIVEFNNGEVVYDCVLGVQASRSP